MRVMRTGLLVLLILGSLARWTTAEINVADTLEWTTADSSVVVVGTVASVTKRRGSGSTTWYHVTLKVNETLKGLSQQTVRFVMRHLSGETPEAWRTRKAELLVFLVDWKRRQVHDGDCKPGVARCEGEHDQASLALRPSHDDSVYELGATTRANTAYTTAFAAITKRDDLLAAVRAAASSKATASHKVAAPSDSEAGRALYSGSTVWLYVPIDATLEHHAQAWILANDLRTREEGVAALAHFKSADNTRRLEKLLADPGTTQITESGQPTVRRCPVRKRAHEVLTAWGVNHATPVIDTKP